MKAISKMIIIIIIPNCGENLLSMNSQQILQSCPKDCSRLWNYYFAQKRFRKAIIGLNLKHRYATLIQLLASKFLTKS